MPKVTYSVPPSTPPLEKQAVPKRRDFAPPEDHMGKAWIRLSWQSPDDFNPEAFAEITHYFRKKKCEVLLQVHPHALDGPEQVILIGTRNETLIFDAIRTRVSRLNKEYQMIEKPLRFSQTTEPFPPEP